MGHRLLEAVADQPQGLQCVGRGVRVPLRGHVALDRVCHRVHPRGRRDVGWQRPRGVGIEHGEPGVHRQVRDLELDVLVAILDHRGERDLRARARRGGDAGQRRELVRAAQALVVARQSEVALPLARRTTAWLWLSASIVRSRARGRPPIASCAPGHAARSRAPPFVERYEWPRSSRLFRPSEPSHTSPAPARTSSAGILARRFDFSPLFAPWAKAPLRWTAPPECASGRSGNWWICSKILACARNI